MTDLFSFTSELLEYNGALVEKNGNELNVILPPDVAKALEAKELSNFLFSADNEQNGTLVSYDSSVFINMSKLLAGKGNFTSVTMPPPLVRVEKLAERIHEKVILNNAVFSVDRSEEKTISYILSFVKYTATSDEKNEGIVSSLINELTLSTARLPVTEALNILISAGEDQKAVQKTHPEANVINALFLAQKEAALENLKEFIESLERRLNRDIQRVHDYYHTLIKETKHFAEKKILRGEDLEKNTSKVKAIETELKWKIQDLISKYSLTIAIKPISIVRIETVVPVFWLTIKRRKALKHFPLTYNPMLKTFDNLPCEACFNPQKSFFVCDVNLHIVCSECFKKCQKCGKDFCRACHTGCPKCK